MKCKNLTTVLMIAIFLVGAAAMAYPTAQATFSLGNAKNTSPFTTNDFEPHIAGPMVYIWPGAGLAAWQGHPSGLPSGYQNPYPTGNPPAAQSNQYQIESSNYQPQGAILASTADHTVTGNLIFAVFLNNPSAVGLRSYKQNYTGVTIYIPSDFDLSTIQQNIGLIESTFGSDASTIITKAGQYDPYGPGFWVITIMGPVTFSPAHQYSEFYYIRINDVIAPQVAGQYFFKVFLWDRFGNMVYPSSEFSGRAVNNNRTPEVTPSSAATNNTVPVANYPVLLVEASPNPAVITGTVRYGTFNASLYGQPIQFAGKVYAVGTALDSTNRPVKAAGYFNASANGHFVVEGLAAPGIYTIYIQAAGFPPQIFASNVNLLPDQVYHVDPYVNPGPVISGIVSSRNTAGVAVWPSTPTAVHVEIYNANQYTAQNLIAYSPLNVTRPPYTSYNYLAPAKVAMPGLVSGEPNGVGPAQFWYVDSAGTFTNGGGTNTFQFTFGLFGKAGVPANFDGHVPQTFATWDNGLTAGRYWIRVYITGYLQTLSDGSTFNPTFFDIAPNEWAGQVLSVTQVYQSSPINLNVRLHDQPGVLINCPISGCIGNAAQGLSAGNRYLIVELRDVTGALVGFNFTFVSQSQSQATVEVNGFGSLGPDQFNTKYSDLMYGGVQDYGLPSGTFTIYAYMRGYAEQAPRPMVTAIGVAATPTVINVDMFRTARLNATIYSIDWEQPYVAQSWEYPTAPMRTWLFNSAGTPVTFLGFPTVNPTTRPEPQTQPRGTVISQIVEFDGLIAADDHGADAAVTQLHTVGGHIAPVWFVLPNTYGNAGFLLIPQWYRLASFAPSDAIPPDTYLLQTFTYGYWQFDTAQMYATNGAFATNRWNLVRSANATLVLDFSTAGVFTPTAFNMSMRVRLFDATGKLVATLSTLTPTVTYYSLPAQPTYHKPASSSFLVGSQAGVVKALTGNMIPAGTSQVQILVSGVYDSYGDPLLTKTLHTNGKIDGLWLGLQGSSSTYPNSYTGGWTAEVDTWNDLPATSPAYPAVEGLLEGDSYHTITGAAATSPLGYAGSTLSWNQLGPYSQNGIQIPNARLGGGTTVIVTLNKRGYYAGSVYAYSKDNSQLLTKSWFMVSATANGVTYSTSTWDSHFEMYLDPGVYQSAFYAWTATGNQGYATQTLSATVNAGQANSATAVQLAESTQAIPEFTAATAPVTLLFAVGIAVRLLRGKRTMKPVT